MRTTLRLDDDAVKKIQAYSQSRQISLGRAASDLIRHGAQYQLKTSKRSGLPVLEAPEDFPVMTTEKVKELLSQE